MTKTLVAINAIDLQDEVAKAVLNTLSYYQEYLELLFTDYQLRSEEYERPV